MKFTTPRRPTVSASARPRATIRTADGSAAVLGLIGWLVFLVVLGVGMGLLFSLRRARAAEQARLAPAVAEIQAATEPRSREVASERETLSAQINEQVQHQEELLNRTRTAELAVKDLEAQVGTLERSQAELTQAVGSLQKAQATAGEGVAASDARLAELERTRDRLKDQYKTRYQALKAAFETAKDSPEAAPMRRFYAEHRDSAFAPAAGYQAAEKLYASKQSSEALRLYKEVLRVYPGSAYGEACTARIAQIEAGGKYSEPAAETAFAAYLPELAAPPSRPAPAAAPEPAEAP